jgi:hypothetical protein
MIRGWGRRHAVRCESEPRLTVGFVSALVALHFGPRLPIASGWFLAGVALLLIVGLLQVMTGEPSTAAIWVAVLSTFVSATVAGVAGFGILFRGFGGG